MAADIRLSRDGIKVLMNSSEMRAELEARAHRIAAAANAAAGDPDGHVVLPAETGTRRARVAVITRTAKAMRQEATQRTLTRSLGAGRG